VTGALHGLRVVEIADGISGPYAGKLLVDLGADVTKIEPPQGDSMRRWGPFPDGVIDADCSGLYEYLNAGKRGATEDDAAAVLADADVLIVDGVGERGWDVPVTVHVSDFGLSGPLRDRQATPLTVQALAGWVNVREQGRPPVQAGARIAEYVAGAYAAMGALTAVRCAGAGVDVDVSLYETLVSTLPYPMVAFEKMRRLGITPKPGGGLMLGVVRAADGWLGINCLTGQHWLDVCAMVGLPEYGELQYAVMAGGPERAEFFEKAGYWLADQRVDDLVELCQAMRIPAAPVTDGASVSQCPQYAQRGFFLETPCGATTFTRPGAPFRLARTPVPPPRPAPRLGERAAPETSTPRWESAGADPAAPFAGVTVLDLSTFWAGAYLTCYLGALGADIVKVESIQRPDGHRYSGAFPFEGDDWYERSVMWQGTNFNKRDITLNLTEEDGRELARELAAKADVVVENFSPRVVEHFGLDYASLAAIKPDVIMVRMPGFGLEGPWRDYVGWALNIEQLAGMAAITGYPDGPPTNLQGPADPIIGVHATVALLAALEHRRRTGEGQLIEVAQIETGAAVTAEPVISASMTGVAPAREGNRRRDMRQGVYPSADESWVALSARHEADLSAIASLLGSPAPDSHDDFDAAVAAWTRARTAADAVDALQGRGVPAEQVMTADRMYDVEQLGARGFYQDMDHPVLGRMRFPGWPFRMMPGPAQHHRSGAPTLGQHNDEVLTELGVSADRIAALRAQGVIGERLP
jgi:crotonobetainyl-CoA:carnitine CoA-transferase CaiB-like acyl-CoA transferase